MSLYNRHLVDRTQIGFDKLLWRKYSKLTRKFYPKFVQPLTLDQVIARYSGGKKKIYTRAKHILITEGLQKKHGVVKMFIKPDRYPEDSIQEKDPRAIQYRHPCFTLGYMCYIAAFEEHIYPSVSYDVVSNTRVIVKGLNPEQRAELLLDKIQYFNRPAYVLLDHSRFDSCINVEHLKSTHRKYERAFGRGIRQYTRMQIHNKGYSKHGIKYSIKGTRMSGDADTGCGNSIVNSDTLYAWLRESGVLKYDFILDGDDSVVIVEQADVKKLNYNIFSRLGFNTKMQIVTDIHDVEFCQSKIIFTQPPKFVRFPWRTFSHSYACRKKYSEHIYVRWLAAVGECELAMNSGVPVMQEYGKQLSMVSPAKLYDEDTKWRMTLQAKEKPITVLARQSFFLAFGVPIPIQLELEKLDFTANQYCRGFGDKVKIKPGQYDESVSRGKFTYESLPTSSSSSWWSCGERSY